MPTMTPAEVLAEYLGLTPETHPWYFRAVPICPICDRQGTSSGSTCCACGVLIIKSDTDFDLALPDPLAPGHEADVWLGVLMRSEKFCRLKRTEYDRYLAAARTRKSAVDRYSSHPTPAIVRAMMAADPEFAAKMEGAME